MNDETDRRRVVDAMVQRHGGMDTVMSAWVKAENEKLTDWTATCRRCHTTITGTLAEIRAHGETCGKESQ